MGKISREAWKCDVCGAEWLPRGEKEPEACPNRECRSRKWNLTRAKLMDGLTTGELQELGRENAAAIREELKQVIDGAAVKYKHPTCVICGCKMIDWGTQWRCTNCSRNWAK